jgi:hypothetical protein
MSLLRACMEAADSHLGEARGQRVMIRSIHPDGSERLTAVKLTNLKPLGGQLF